MNTHPEELLSAWIDGEASDEQRTIVEKHLEACASCREIVDNLRAIGTSTAEISSLNDKDTKQFLAEHLIRRASAEKKAFPVLRREVSSWTLMAVAVLVFGVGTYVAVDLSQTIERSFQGGVASEETMGKNQAALSGGIY